MIVENETLERESIDLQSLVESIRNSNDYQREALKTKISKEEAERLLKRLSGGKLEIIEDKSECEVSLINSKKPLWVDEVKRTCESFIPEVDMKDLEITKDILVKEENEDIFVSLEDYPYFQTIKKLQYAFGDVYKGSQRTVIYLHDFLKRFLLLLAKILNECDFKKTFEHLYSYEFSKFYNYKKLKFKNSFEDPPEEEALSESENLGFGMDDVIEDEEVKNEIKGKNYLETIFEEKDDNYFENLAFQDQRTSSMSHAEYLDFISCRHQTFLTKGKKTFINYLQSTLQTNFPYELKDNNNLEFLSYLCKEILRKIVTEAIRNKHAERKLFVLNFPILVEDIEDICNYEIEKVEIFLSDYYSDNYLMKELKKKKSMKNLNKNVKVKKVDGTFLIVIKKMIFLDDVNQIDFLRKNKKKSEEHLMSILNLLSLKYTEISKGLKKEGKNETETNRRKRKTKTNEHNSQKDALVTVEPISNTKLLCDLKVSNYYEYFLLSPFLIDDLENKIKTSHLEKVDLDGFKAEINAKVSLIKRSNRKIISDKFKIWLKLTNIERNYIIDEYNKLTNANDIFYNEEDSNM